MVIFHSYVNVYQRVIQPDCKCSTDSMFCLTFVLGIVSGATLTSKKSWDKQCYANVCVRIHLGESARVGSCLGEQGGLVEGGCPLNRAVFPSWKFVDMGIPHINHGHVGSWGSSHFNGTQTQK